MMGIGYNFGEIEAEKNCKFIKTENCKISSLLMDKEVNDDFFTFLIENRMNRYLFDFISKIKDLNIDNISFCNPNLDPKTIKKICGESFIKKYSCPNCGHLLYRKHLYEIADDEYFEFVCPKCGKNNQYSFFDLEDDFEINKLDLIKFLDRIVGLKVFYRELIAVCSYCVEDEKVDIENDKFDLKCSCGNLREINYSYHSFYDFLTDRSGYWFEWYVYNLTKYLYPHTYPNYECEYYVNGKKLKCEMDVLVFNEGQVEVYECKDYVNRNKDISSNDFSENLVKLRNISDKIIIVSSTKKIKENSKIETSDLYDIEIEYLEGMDLEKKFLADDSILKFFKDRNYKIVYLYDKLQFRKKKTILKNILDLMILNEEEIYLIILNQILSRAHIKNLLGSLVDLLNSSIDISLENIFNDKFVSSSLNFINNLIHLNHSIFEGKIDLNRFIEKCTNFLNPNSFNGYEERAPFYYFICCYFKIFFSNDYNFNREVIENFLLKFVPMIGIYYGNNSVRNTLYVFECLTSYINEDIQNELVNKLISEYESAFNVKKQIFTEFSKKINSILSKENKNRLVEKGILMT